MKEHIPKREIKICVPKAKKAEIMDHADSRGESMSSFIRRAIDEALEREKKEEAGLSTVWDPSERMGLFYIILNFAFLTYTERTCIPSSGAAHFHPG